MKSNEKTTIDRMSLVNAIIEANNTPYDNLSIYNELIVVFEQLIDLEIKKDKYINSMSTRLSIDAKKFLINAK